MYKEIKLPQLTLKALINNTVSHFANQPSIAFVDGIPMSYGEFGLQMNRLSELLESYGLNKGDKVALFSHNMPNWVIAYFAIVARGMVVVPILPDFSSEEVKNVIEHSESKVLFVSERLQSKIEGLQTNFLTHILTLDTLDLTHTTPSQLKEVEVLENDLAAIIYTSGTTGRSKGVMLTHQNIMHVTCASYQVYPIHQHDVFLSFLPLSHTYENTIGMLFPIMYGASIYYLEKPPTAAALLPALSKIRPTLMLSVPLIMEKIYKVQVQGKFSKNHFSRIIYKTPLFRKIIHRIAGKKLYQTFGGRLKFFGIGGAKLDSRVERFLREARFPYAIGYGLTETAPLLAGASPHQTKMQSTGYAIRGVQLCIHSPNERGVGEIWAKGPNVMTGYYKNPEATSEVITPDGWFKTGDLGYLDSKKRLFIKGRMKNTIIGPSGENIYPEDIESVINNSNYVLESLVVEEDGYLVAKVLLDIDNIEKQYKHLQKIIEEKKEHYHEWLKHLTQEFNSRLNKNSQVKRIDVMDNPFEKTASQKIKRFKYHKPKK